jgi:putative iron-regulated protein
VLHFGEKDTIGRRDKPMIRTLLTTTALVAALAGTAITQTPAEVLDTYGDIAEANYTDSLAAAEALQAAVAALIDAPSPATLQAAGAA